MDCCRGDDLAEGITEKSLVLIAECIWIVSTGWSEEVKENMPCGELIRLTFDLGLIEEGALEVELGEGDGRDDEVGSVKSVKDDVVISRRRINEQEVVG